MLQKEADIRTVRANNLALEVRIKAQASADEKKILVQAENDTRIARAKASAKSVEIEVAQLFVYPSVIRGKKTHLFPWLVDYHNISKGQSKS